MNCPINEQTGDGKTCGRCCFHLPDGVTCPRHGDVSVEVKHFEITGKTTLENTMRERKGKPLLGKATVRKNSVAEGDGFFEGIMGENDPNEIIW